MMTNTARALALVLSIICFVWFGAALAAGYVLAPLILIVFILVLLQGAMRGRIL